MSRSLVCLWSFVMFASAAILFATGTRAARAQSQARQALHELRTISDQATELSRLRQSRTDFPERPDGGLASKVSAAMSRAGLASTILQSLSPEAQSGLAGEVGAKLSRQRATATLAGLSLPQVGKFLDAWRTAEPDWIVSSIDLAPISTGGKDGPAPIGTDLPLRAVITIEGVFKDSPKQGASR